MATTRKSTKSTASTKAAVLEDTAEETTPAEASTKQVIAEGITRFAQEANLGVQHARYKVMRAIAYQAFADAVENGTFDQLVDDAIANADNLPTGWGLERSVAAEKPAPKAKAPVAKKTTAKAPAKSAPAAKATPAARPARKRPTR